MNNIVVRIYTTDFIVGRGRDLYINSVFIKNTILRTVLSIKWNTVVPISPYGHPYNVVTWQLMSSWDTRDSISKIWAINPFNTVTSN